MRMLACFVAFLPWMIYGVASEMPDTTYFVGVGCMVWTVLVIAFTEACDD